MTDYKFNSNRNAYVKTLKIMITCGRAQYLTDLDKKILVNEERLGLKISFYKVYQLGDPQEIEDLYKETCNLIDEAICKMECKNDKQNCKLE